MKNKSKRVLLAAAAGLMAATAQAQYVNGDLIAGFKGGANDYILDLGPYSSISLGQSWNVGANRGTQFGVVGALNAGQHIFATSSDSAQNGFSPLGLFTPARADVATIGSGLTLGTSRTPAPGDTTSWSFQTGQPAGTPGKSFQNDFYNPNVNAGSTAFLFDNANDGTVKPLGSFSYESATGKLTFQAVPEPATYALAAVGALGFLVRRKYSHKAS